MNCRLITALFLSSLAVVCTASARVWYVKGSSPDGGDGRSWATAFRTLEAAAEAGSHSGEIWVAAGTYKLENAANFWEVSLYGGFVGNELNRIERAAENYAVIEGFESYYASVSAQDCIVDGLVFEASAELTGRTTIANCTFEVRPEMWGYEVISIVNSIFNDGFYGSGDVILRNSCVNSDVELNASLFAEDTLFNGYCSLNDSYTDASFRRCNFENASVCSDARNLSFQHCSFTGASSSAISVSGGESLTVEECTFVGNGNVLRGAAIHLYPSGSFLSAQIINSTFSNNDAVYGGAISVGPCVFGEIRNCTFNDNNAVEDGGAVQVFYGSMLEFTNCLFTNNSSNDGAALYAAVHAQAHLQNCTLFGNSADDGALAATENANIEVKNSIVWGNSPQAFFTDNTSATIAATYSCIQGGAPGEGNVDSDPRFADADGGKLWLSKGSPCIDGGADEDAPATDIEGIPRPLLKGVDMGAYEMGPLGETGGGCFSPSTPSSGSASAGADGITITILMLCLAFRPRRRK